MTEQEQMIEDCEHREERLSDWDRSFIDSISKRRLHLGRFSTAEEAEQAYLAAKKRLHPFAPKDNT